MRLENLTQQIEYNTGPGPEYISDIAESGPAPESPVRVIAYYLPQFHPIEENNRWWGKGFTEWTNVTKALPRFVGHFQPRLPGDLGFYDLRLPQTLREQVTLAKRYGVHGFCFHYYWFQGCTLLDKPLKLLLNQPDIDLPFCVNWANENWTRRWSGHDDAILIGQRHSPDDDVAFAASLAPLFRDSRYIHVNGRPLLMIYRPSQLPDASATVKRWRSYFLEAGMKDPYVVMAQTFGEFDPRKYGMDAAAGFPPHNGGFDATRIPVGWYDSRRKGQVIKYDDMVSNTLVDRPSEYTHFPGVCPGWDNEARRPEGGVCFVGSTPAKYGNWLRTACHSVTEADDPTERVVFVNAWNEWAEGAYLEPDRHYGYAYLAETLSVLQSLATNKPYDLMRNATATVSATTQALTARKHVDCACFVRRLFAKFADIAEAVARRLRQIASKS